MFYNNFKKKNPKNSIYMIGYTDYNIHNSNNLFFFDGQTPLHKILEQQSIEPPELIFIFHISRPSCL